jgi:agmatine deiminase
MPPPTDRELIVLAAPVTGDPYYFEQAAAILDFHVAFALEAEAYDDVLILVDDGAFDAYAAALGPRRVVRAPMADIWTRDFGLANPARPVMFRYTAEGQGGGRKGQRDADAVQDDFAALADTAGAVFAPSDLLNDGGNWVVDEGGRAILSRKFLRDNALTEDSARKALQALTGVRHIAFIEADEQGGLEHADGVVAFVDPNTVVINSYPGDPDYSSRLKADLRRALPDVAIHEIVTPYDGSVILDERFGSACGLYTNMLVTPSRIYLPQFGIPEDAEALATVRAVSRKQVIPVQSGKVCHMGGGVRCLSMQLRGDAAARFKAELAATP